VPIFLTSFILFSGWHHDWFSIYDAFLLSP